MVRSLSWKRISTPSFEAAYLELVSHRKDQETLPFHERRRVFFKGVVVDPDKP